MGQLKRGGYRRINTNKIAYAAGQRQDDEIGAPSNKFIKRLWMAVEGQLVISAVTVPGKVHTDGPVNLVQDVEITVDGAPWKKGPLGFFFRYAQKYDQTDGVNEGLVGGGAGTYNFKFMVPFFAEMPSSRNPNDSLLDGRKIEKIGISILWGSEANLIVNNTSTLALQNVKTRFYVEETDPFDVNDENGNPQSFWLFRQRMTKIQNVVTTDSTKLPIPVKKFAVMRSVLARAIDGVDLSDDVINIVSELSLNAGEEVPIKNIEDDDFQAITKHQFGTDTDPEGYVFIELAENGLVLSTGLGANGAVLNDCAVIMDTTAGVAGSAATTIEAMIAELVPPGAPSD